MKKNILARMGIFLLSLSTVPSFSAPPNWKDKLGACSKAFVTIQSQEVGGKRILKFADPEVIEHLDGMRANLRSAMAELSTRFKEMDHVARRLFLTRMMMTHAYIYGPPGGAKSAVVEAVMNTPMFNIHLNDFIEDKWAIQLHQLLGDAPFKGYINYDQLKKEAGEFKKQITVDEVNSRGAMIHAETVLIDELEKGNPISFAALLDVLNEKVARHGAVTLKVRTKTVHATSNMTVYDFVESLRQLGLESTARPFLDRLVFKVYAHNYVTDPKLRFQLLQEQEARDSDEAESWLMDPKLVRTESTAEVQNAGDKKSTKLPYIDYVWLGLLAKRGIKMDVDSTKALEQLLDQTRTSYFDKRSATEADKKINPDSSDPVYYPPFVFSQRNMMQYATNTVKTSLLMDLLLTDPKKLPTEAIAQELQRGLLVSPTSIYRVQELVTTGAPGDPRITVNEDGTKFDIEYGPQLAKLLEHPLDSNERALLSYIDWERKTVGEIFKTIINDRKAAQKKGSELLAALARKIGYRSTTEIKDLEQLLYLLNPREVSPSGN